MPVHATSPPTQIQVRLLPVYLWNVRLSHHEISHIQAQRRETIKMSTMLLRLHVPLQSEISHSYKAQ